LTDDTTHRKIEKERQLSDEKRGRGLGRSQRIEGESLTL
jgi:hypothetical protein